MANILLEDDMKEFQKRAWLVFVISLSPLIPLIVIIMDNKGADIKGAVIGIGILIGIVMLLAVYLILYVARYKLVVTDNSIKYALCLVAEQLC